MSDARQTRQQLVQEVASLRQRIAQLEADEGKPRPATPEHRASEDSYRFVVEHQMELICRFRPDTTLTFANNAYCRYFGKTRQELIGSSFLSLIPERERPAARRHIASLRQHPRVVRTEHEVLLPSGETAWQQWVTRAIVDGQEQTQVFLAVGRDVTKRRQAETALQESEARYRTLVEGSIQGISVVDRNGNRLFANSAYADIFGYENPDELLGKPVIERVAPQDRKRMRSYGLALARGTPMVARFEYQGIRKDGCLIWLESRISVVTWEGEAALLVTLVDISERKRADEALLKAYAELEHRVTERTIALQESNQRLVQEVSERSRSEQALRTSEGRWRSLVMSAPAIISVVDLAGIIVFTNRGMQGMPGDEMVGQSLGDCIPRDQQARLQYEMGHVRRTGKSWHYEATVLSPDGSIIWLANRLTALKQEDTVTGFLHVSLDVTEQKMSELVTRQRERLVSLGTLSAGIAHEINNPLGSILLAAEHAQRTHCRPQDTDVTRECLNDIITNIQRCSRIVKSVLQFARQEPGDKWPIDINQIVRTACDITQQYVKQHDAHITVEPGTAFPLILVNPIEIEQVLVNLIRNAVEADSACITVRTELVADHLQIVVHDTGSGIASEHISRIFDPFYTTRQDTGGTGLGLSLVHGIITDHGGTIDVRSTLGHSTTVRIKLPLALSASDMPHGE